MLGIAPTLATGAAQCQGFRLQGPAHFMSWSSGSVTCVSAGLELAQHGAAQKPAHPMVYRNFTEVELGSHCILLHTCSSLYRGDYCFRGQSFPKLGTGLKSCHCCFGEEPAALCSLYGAGGAVGHCRSCSTARGCGSSGPPAQGPPQAPTALHHCSPVQPMQLFSLA